MADGGLSASQVSVSKCDGVTDRGIVWLCLRCPGLTLLNVADCIHVTAHFVHMLVGTWACIGVRGSIAPDKLGVRQ